MDCEIGRRDACRILERFARCTICELVILVLQALQTYRRIVDVVADILREATICRTRKCTRVRNVKKQRALAIGTRKGGLAEWVFLAILRRVERRTIRIDDLFLGNRVRRDCCLARLVLHLVVLVQDTLEFRSDDCIHIVITNMVRLRSAFDQCIRRAVNSRRELRLIAIDQACERTRILKPRLDCRDISIRCRKAVRMDCQISLIDGQISLRVDDFVVDTCITHEADIFHIDGIFIRIGVSICCRATILILSIGANGLDGQNIGAIVERVVIFFDKGFARYAFLLNGERCCEFPVVDGRIAIGLAAAAVDVDLASEDFDGAAILCSGIFIAACFTFVRQVVVVRSFDVVNRIVLRFTGRCFIAARTRCLLCPAFARERAAAIVVVGYVAFVEGIRIFVDVMFVLILSNERCFSCGRDIGIRQFLAVDFRHVVSGDINGRLYLEDVLVAVVLTCQIRSARRTPLCVRAAVEVRAELIGIWRVGIDLPVAARTGLDGRDVCRGQVLERTACTLHIDDNSIVVLRIGVQRTVIMLFVQYDRAIRRGQVDVFMRLDAIDMDVARSLDVDAFSIRCNAVANCDVLARDTDTFVRVNNARVVAAAADCNIASVDLDILQSNRVAEVTGNVDFRIASIDDESRMRQILFLDKATNRSSSL